MIIKNTVACAVLIFIITTAHGQKVDSLKRLLSSQTDANKIAILYQLSWEHINVDNKQALSFALEAYNLSIESRDSFRTSGFTLTHQYV